MDSVFQRADIQVIRELLISGYGDENSIDKRPYRQRIDEDTRPMHQFLESKYPDGKELDAAFSVISDAITAHQEVYFEIGMKCGARLLHQLLFEQEPGQTDAPQDEAKGGGGHG